LCPSMNAHEADPRFDTQWHIDVHHTLYGYIDDETREFVPGVLQQGKRHMEVQEQRDALLQKGVTYFGRGVIALIGIGILNASANLGLSDMAIRVLKAAFGVK